MFVFDSVFSVLVSVAGEGLTIVVLLSFFSVFSPPAGGVTVVSFCSHAASNAALARMQMYFVIRLEWMVGEIMAWVTSPAIPLWQARLALLVPLSLQARQLQRVPQAQPFRFFVHKRRAKRRLPGSKCIS
jgi:hypothetical protein